MSLDFVLASVTMFLDLTNYLSEYNVIIRDRNGGQNYKRLKLCQIQYVVIT